MKSKYYKHVSLDGNEYVIRTIDPNAPQNLLSHSNALIMFANGNPTGGWFRTFTDEDFESFEPLDTAEFELQLAMSKHLVK